MLILIAAILIMENSTITYTKETIQNFMAVYGRGWATLAKILHCLCIFSMPIIAKSPLTMLPLIGLVFSLMVTFYTRLTYKKVIYIPEIFLCIASLLYLTCKVQTLGQYSESKIIEAIVKFIGSHSDTSDIVRLCEHRICSTKCLLNCACGPSCFSGCSDTSTVSLKSKIMSFS